MEAIMLAGLVVKEKPIGLHKIATPQFHIFLARPSFTHAYHTETVATAKTAKTAFRTQKSRSKRFCAKERFFEADL